MNDPVVFSHEKLILEKLDVELTGKSPFVDVSCMWLKGQGYRPVTYNLYYHFLNAFIHPFIGKKPIGLVDQNNIRRIYTYFNTVNTNETWIGQIHLVMRSTVEDWMAELEECIERHRDVKTELKKILPTYHEAS